MVRDGEVQTLKVKGEATIQGRTCDLKDFFSPTRFWILCQIIFR